MNNRWLSRSMPSAPALPECESVRPTVLIPASRLTVRLHPNEFLPELITPVVGGHNWLPDSASPRAPLLPGVRRCA